jgi:uncharacterized protein (DUF2062 family)
MRWKMWMNRWRRRASLLWRKIVTQQDTPHRIARGCAIGIFIAWLPLMGIQIPLTILCARLCRANVLAAIPWSFITNPVTAVPFYYAHYRLGLLLCPGTEPIGWERFSSIWSQVGATAEDALGIVWWKRWWHQLTDSAADTLRLLGDILLPMTIGTVLIGVPVMLFTYHIMYRYIVGRRQRRLAPLVDG